MKLATINECICLGLHKRPRLDQLLASASPERASVIRDFSSLEQRVNDLRDRLRIARAAARKATDSDPKESIEELEKKIKEALRQYKEFTLKLKKDHPKLAVLVSDDPMTLSTVQSMLKPDQALLQYMLLPDRGWMFLTTRDELISLDLGVGRQQLDPLIQQYRWQLQTPAATRGFTLDPTIVQRAVMADAPRELSRLLLQPVLDKLAGKRHLTIIPNGDLHFLPFAALPVDGHYLVERLTLSTLSSASLLAHTRPVTVPLHPRLLALANPVRTGLAPLPGTEAEAQAIGTHYPDPDKRLYFRERAQRSILVGQDLRGWNLHLAVHGQAGAMNTTRLQFSDGDLTLADVWNLYLDDAPLVVLSACETALGEQLGGDEVVSLANGFIFAGAQALVSSLWPVPDEPTRALMEEFYRQRNQGPAAALAAAQRALIKDGHDPYHWAGFIVAGW